MVEIETVENNLRFPGQYYDNETGLHYNYHSYSDSTTGRYLRADTIGLEGGANLYLYANANSIKHTDSTGLWIYRGYCRYISGGEILGIGQIRCRVWTECRIDGCFEEGEIVAMFVGITAGLPVGVAYFNIKQDSKNFSSEPSLDELCGIAAIYLVSYELGVGSSIAVLYLGNTTEEYCGYQGGVDASADALSGCSWIDWRTKSICY